MKVERIGLLQISDKLTYIFLRSVLGIIFITHGTARIYYWSVGDFGDFLNTKGLVFGNLIAWIITIGEILGGILLFTGYKVKIAVIFHFLIIVSGIFLVHFENGWFVVGHGQNGVEYSLLILTVLIFTYSQESRKKLI